MKEIINERLVFRKKDIKSKADLFKAIVDKIKSEKRTNHPSKLLKDIIEREELGTTCFENGLMIPHARTKYVSDVTLVLTSFNDCKFDSLDGEKTNFSVSIIVPEDAEDKHLLILSKISGLLSTKEKLENFKKLTTKLKVKELLKITNAREVDKKSSNKNYEIVAVTACAAGIAHTYMARDSLLNAAKKMGVSIKIETQGAITENVLTNQEISSAKSVIFAVDSSIEKTRFKSKETIMVSTNQAIKDGENVIRQAIKKSKKSSIPLKNSDEEIGADEKKGFFNDISKALMTAVSYMLPIIVAGALLFAIPNAIAGLTGGRNSAGVYESGKLPKFLQAMSEFGLTGFAKLAIPIIGMYIAYAIGGRPAMAAGLIGTYFANDGNLLYKYSYLTTSGSPQGAGFLGAIVIGLFAGFTVKYMRWIKWHKFIKPATGIIFIPLISTFLTFIFTVYVIGAPIAWLMSQIYNGLQELKGTSKIVIFLIGAIFGGMIAFDFGGPIGKISWFVSTAIFTDTVKSGNPNLMPVSAMAASISLAPIGVFLATKMFRKKFTKQDIQAGKAALPLGLVGISEGALPFAFKDPLKLMFANVVSGIMTSGTIAALGVIQWGGLGSPIGGWIGYTEHSWYGFLWCFIIMGGCFLTAIIYGLLKKPSAESKTYYKEWTNERKLLWESRGMTIEKKDYYKRFLFTIKHGVKKMGPKLAIMLNPRNWFQKPKDW